MADTEKLVFQTDDGKEVEFEIIESTRVNGADYIFGYHRRYHHI